MSSFLHGVEVIELESGTRTIQTVRSSVIGLVGTAPKGPVNIPTLITPAPADIAQFGSGLGTIPAAIAAIQQQIGALIVAINVCDPDTHKTAVEAAEYTFDDDDELEVADDYIMNPVVKNTAGDTTYTLDTDYSYDSDTGVFTRLATIAEGATVSIAYDKVDPSLVDGDDIIGGVDAETAVRTGISALLDANSIVGVTPKILIAPSYTAAVTRTEDVITGAPVTTAMVSIADQLRAVILSEGPSTTDAEAITYRDLFGSKRVFIIDPTVKVGTEQTETPNSAYVAGVIAKNDQERGFWTSPSNREINGIVGTSRQIDFTLGDPNARANLLNENEVATIIQQDGYRLWGNRTCSSDSKWAFLAHVRLNDMLLESLLQAHLWAVDRNITKTYNEDVADGVNAYLRQLQGQGAVSGGLCWPSGLNTAETMDGGQVYFDFDYGRYGVAERVSFRAAVNNDYTVSAVFG